MARLSNILSFSRLVLAAVLACCAVIAEADDSTRSQKPAETDPKIARLIQELGSEHYATRERAASELAQLGLAAFDALHAAQQHDDVEIAERAHYLLNSMKVAWSQPDDSAEVKRILKDYGQQKDEERRTRINQLASLEDAAGIDALCRLVRYEMSSVLSKEAALQVMTQESFALPMNREVLRRSVMEQMGHSRRPPARWLRTYVRTLDDPAALAEEWKQLLAEERQLLARFGDKQSSKKILQELYRWHADYLQKLDRSDEAIESIRQIVALSEGDREQLMAIVDWLLQRKAYGVVEEVAARHAQRFAEDALLLYRLAEAQSLSGQQEKAQETADKAFAMNPTDAQRHLLAGYQLQERGRYEWSEREYRTVIKQVEMLSLPGIEARSMLAEMLHDQQRDKNAAEVLSDLVKAIEGDDNVADSVNNLSRRRSPGEIRSRMYFFAGLDHLTRDETDEAREALRKGSEANEEDADLLIAMFHLPNADEAWKKRTGELIDKAAADFKSMVDQMQTIIDQSDFDQQNAEAKTLQAMFCNQYAWLVGNTQGDVQEAIRLSKRSLEIRPDSAGYMDTLAHCYFRAGDLENAVRWQSRAVKLEPHSGQITRALAKFEKALLDKTKQ